MSRRDEPCWIVVRNWERFQHYRDRTPPWIKLYPELLHDDAWLDLTPVERSVLVGIWLAYASARRTLARDTAKLTRTLGQRVTNVTLERLNDAGFIEFSASKPLAPRALAETETETETEIERSLGRRTSDTPRARASDGAAAFENSGEAGSNSGPLRPARPDPADLDAVAASLADADARTVNVLRKFRRDGLPVAAFARALESLEHRRTERKRPRLVSEVRYYVAALSAMRREGLYE